MRADKNPPPLGAPAEGGKRAGIADRPERPTRVSKRLQLAFGFWQQVPGNVEEFFCSLEEEIPGKGRAPTLQEACARAKVPYTLVHRMIAGSPELKARYEAILAARAETLVEKAIRASEKAHDRDSAACAKVQADTYLKVASKWDRERYGDRLEIEKSVTVTVGEDLLGAAGDLLKLAKRPAKVIEGEVLPALEETNG